MLVCLWLHSRQKHESRWLYISRYTALRGTESACLVRGGKYFRRFSTGIAWLDKSLLSTDVTLARGWRRHAWNWSMPSLFHSTSASSRRMSPACSIRRCPRLFWRHTAICKFGVLETERQREREKERAKKTHARDCRPWWGCITHCDGYESNVYESTDYDSSAPRLTYYVLCVTHPNSSISTWNDLGVNRRFIGIHIKRINARNAVLINYKVKCIW